MKEKLELEHGDEIKAKLEVENTHEKNATLEVEKAQNETAKEESLEVTRMMSRSQSSGSHVCNLSFVLVTDLHNVAIVRVGSCMRFACWTGAWRQEDQSRQLLCIWEIHSTWELPLCRLRWSWQSRYRPLQTHYTDFLLGHIVSSFVKHHLPLVLTQQLNKLGRSPDDDQIKQVLSSAFLEVQESLMNSPIDIEFSGTTATIGYLVVSSCCFLAKHNLSL